MPKIKIGGNCLEGTSVLDPLTKIALRLQADIEHFTPLRLPNNKVFNTIKDQPLIKV